MTIQKALDAWRRGSDARWEFAEAAADVVGGYEVGATLSLAEQIKRRVDTVENHAVAWKLWTKVKDYPDAELYRKQLDIGHWIAVARHWRSKKWDEETAFDWLVLARDGGWVVEQLREEISKVYGGKGWKDGYFRVKSSLEKHVVQNERLGMSAEQEALAAELAKIVKQDVLPRLELLCESEKR